ncbi:hypothetical protein Droror1_Dr00010693 [Drosera rotundifolia]
MSSSPSASSLSSPLSAPSSNAPCAACKVQRRKCVADCIFAPYFPPDNQEKFIKVHKAFGAARIGNLLKEINPAHREATVTGLVYEAESRLADPMYGPVAHIFVLQSELKKLIQYLEHYRMELAYFNSQGGAGMPQPVIYPTTGFLMQNQHPLSNVASSSNADLMHYMQMGPSTVDHHHQQQHFNYPQLMIGETQHQQHFVDHHPHGHMVQGQHSASGAILREEQEMMRKFQQL